jgi:serine protease AprX
LTFYKYRRLITMILFRGIRNKNFFLSMFFYSILFPASILVICSNGVTIAFEGGDNPLEAKIAPWLKNNLATTSNNGFLVVLEDQADLRGARLHIRREEKIRSVHEMLHSKSKKTQADLQKWLDERGIKYKPYSIVNMIHVYGDETLVSILASRPDVKRIEGNPAIRGIGPRDFIKLEATNEEQSNVLKGQDRISSPSVVEWNIAKIRTPEVWSTFDITGTGIVVAGNDTGVQWDHPALINNYRGWNGSQVDHKYNWLDAINNVSTPYDDNGHGTHTLGTVMGDDRVTNKIGVAPGAQWIACRNMDNGYGTPATYLECLEFFLAPYPMGGNPSQGDTSKAPHIINNSWYCPLEEGCSHDTLLDAVNSLRAAGIMVVAAAGNFGPACTTINSPPAIYDASFSVGATNSNDGIASFSSRGPITIDSSNRLKPNISAPGVGIRSSVTLGTYTQMSGTSMASPHVAGAVALLWSAVPDLLGNIEATEYTITQTGVPRTTSQTCGGIPGTQVPNNTYGWGRLDIFSAVSAALLVPKLHIRKEGTGAGVIMSNPFGIDCGLACDAYFIEGTAVTLTATSDSGAAFSHWSGGCSGTEDTCQLTITGDMTVTAAFILKSVPQYKLKVSRKRMKRGNGDIVSEDGAIVCTQDTKRCSTLYNPGMSVTLFQQVTYPNTFLGWQPADLCPGTDSCTIIMDGTKTIKGFFHGPNKLTVSIRSVKKGIGTVTGPNLTCPGECKKNYQKDEPISLIATEGSSSTFTEWIGCPLPSGNTCSIAMDKAYTVRAVFTGPLLSE